MFYYRYNPEPSDKVQQTATKLQSQGASLSSVIELVNSVIEARADGWGKEEILDMIDAGWQGGIPLYPDDAGW